MADLLAEEQPASNHDIHASILNLMRLTDVAGELVPQITGTPKKA